MEANVGVINPYAVAELVVDKQIRWNRLVDPVAELSSILRLPEQKIFAADSPLLRPDLTVDLDSELMLPDNEARARLQDFLASNLPPEQSARPSRSGVLIKERTEPLAELVQPKTESNSEPWQPANIEWVDKGDFYEDVGEINDPIQGAIGNCYFIAAMSSVAWSRPYAIANFARPSSWGDDDSPVHRVTFYKDGRGDGETIEVSERVPVVKGSHHWRYARSRDLGEVWPAVLEKAFSKWKNCQHDGLSGLWSDGGRRRSHGLRSARPRRKALQRKP